MDDSVEVLTIAFGRAQDSRPAFEDVVRDSSLPRVAITIPLCFDETYGGSSSEVLRWRTAVLDGFEFYLSHGYTGTGEVSEHGFRYLLER